MSAFEVVHVCVSPLHRLWYFLLWIINMNTGTFFCSHTFTFHKHSSLFISAINDFDPG